MPIISHTECKLNIVLLATGASLSNASSLCCQSVCAQVDLPKPFKFFSCKQLRNKTLITEYTAFNRLFYYSHADEAGVSLTTFICTTVGVSVALAVVVGIIVGVVTALTCRNKLQPSTDMLNHVLPARVSPEYEEVNLKDIYLASNGAYGY